MASDERISLMRQGDDFIKSAHGQNVVTKTRVGRRKFERHVTPGKILTTIAEVIELRDQLKSLAEEIVEDFEEQRENFGDAEAFLESWEERAGYKSESWETVVSTLEDIEPEESDDEEESVTVDELLGEIEEAWGEGER